jgi:hypothetical protein
MSAHELLHDAVFERVETDNHQSTAFIEDLEGLRQHHRQLFKLLIDVNPYSLEGARRRVLMWLARGNGFCHDLGKLPCAVDRPARSSRNNRSCNLFSKPFFAIAPDDLPDLLFRRLLQPLRRGLPAARIHPHVERPVEAEAESPFRLVKLRRGHAEVEQHAVDMRNTCPANHLPQRTELGMEHGKSRIGHFGCGSDRHGIAIQGDQLPGAAKPRQNRPAVSAAAEGCVHVAAIGPDAQRLDRFFKQYRLM